MDQPFGVRLTAGNIRLDSATAISRCLLSGRIIVASKYIDRKYINGARNAVLRLKMVVE